MGLLDRLKGKDTRFGAWLKAEYHAAALPPEIRAEEVWHPFVGRIEGERLRLDLQPEMEGVLVTLGTDAPVASPLAQLSRQDSNLLRQEGFGDSRGPFPLGWVLDGASDPTLAVLVVAPRALRQHLERLSQRVRVLGFHGQTLSASVHLHKDEPQRVAVDLAALLDLLRFQRDPHDDAAAPPPPEAAPPEAEAIPSTAVPPLSEPQLDLLAGPPPAPPEAGFVTAAPVALGAEVHVTALANGPLLVHGPVDMEQPDGTHVHLPDARVPFCRCGQSTHKPFCDGTHKRMGFVAQ